VNFIGHLLVARWDSELPAFGLGAMLPDFASMAGIRLTTVADADVARGVALHHRTDDVFHACPAFVALSRDAFTSLVAAGVERGPARAVAHIGVELLIDGELLRDRSLGDAYLSALSAFAALPDAALPEPEHGALGRVSSRLSAYGIPYDYERPEVVTTRLISILGRRPRLALSDSGATLVGRMMPDLKGRVVVHLPQLLESLAHGLSSPRYSRSTTR
jgi:acyl carrier protein phosphodiesterase